MTARRLGGPWGVIARDVLNGADAIPKVEARARPDDRQKVRGHIHQMEQAGLLKRRGLALSLTDRALEQLGQGERIVK